MTTDPLSWTDNLVGKSWPTDGTEIVPYQTDNLVGKSWPTDGTEIVPCQTDNLVGKSLPTGEPPDLLS